MILTGPEIARRVTAGDIRIDPYDSHQLNPNSYNVLLAGRLLTYDADSLDSAVDNPHSIVRIPDEGYVLQPSRIYLGATREVIGSELFVPIVRGRSSTARLGLFVHVTADLVDLGYFGQLTLQLHAVQPLRVFNKMAIGQVTFWATQGERVIYSGKYQGSQGPQASKSYLDLGSARGPTPLSP